VIISVIAINDFLEQDDDIRFATLQGGHSTVKTTQHNYLHKIDLKASMVLKNWTIALN
jgi:hypothetical protein